jgi:uncharacterized cupin superfamily protein
MSETARLALPAIDPMAVPGKTGETDYPEIFQAGMTGATRRRLGNAAGLKNFGVNLTTLPPGCASALRHWHSKQDEFVYVLAGELVLISDCGEQVLTIGMAAGFPAGVPDGHQLISRSDRDATFLEIGDRSPGDDGDYPDIDMIWRCADGDQRYVYLHRDGTPY